MTVPDYDRQPTSHAERVRWRVADHNPRVAWTDEVGATTVGLFGSEGLAAEAVWSHNVMVAAREQRAMRDAALTEGGAGT